MTPIEVLGPGCRRCTELDQLVRDTIASAGISADYRSVTDPREIVSPGFFMPTPALVIDGHVVATGMMPSRREIARWRITNGSDAPAVGPRTRPGRLRTHPRTGDRIV